MADKYVFRGSKNKWDKTKRVVLKGGSIDPELYLDRDGDPVELTDDQVKDLRSQGWKINKVSDNGTEEADPSDKEKEKVQQREQAAPAKETDARGSANAR